MSCVCGAQRLSASEGKTAEIIKPTVKRDDSCSTPFGIRGENRRMKSRELDEILDVLNAFRHQRGKQFLDADAIRVACGECSTPFGIRGENRDKERGQSAVRREVLNAFRHQRGKQLTSKNALQAIIRCSTPFGIRGENRQLPE